MECLRGWTRIGINGLAGNRTNKMQAGGLGSVTVSESYTYDAVNQLTDVKYNASNPDTTPSGWSNDVTYSFDAAGNRTNVVMAPTGGSTNATSYSANNLNQYTSIGGTNLTYDANGNLTGDGVWSYTYDSENRLVQASNGTNTIAYTYDPSGRLTSLFEPPVVLVRVVVEGLSPGVQSAATAQPVGLSEPEAVCSQSKSISVFGRAPPSLRRGWTKTKPKCNITPGFGLTHALAQSKWSGQVH